MSKPRKKPHEQTMWVIKDISAPKHIYFLNGIMEYRRSDCIDAFMDGARYSWSKYRKEGYRCVKVKVTEIAKWARKDANLPSEEELKTLVFRYTGDHQYPDYSGAAEAILERIRSVK